MELFEDPMSLFSGYYPLVEEEQAAQEVPSGLECAPQGKGPNAQKGIKIQYASVQTIKRNV